MKKIISNILASKVFWLFLFLLQQVISFAHDCSSPGDCEETAGYNAAVAIVGGAIALVSGIVGSSFATPPPDTILPDDTIPDQEEPVTDTTDEDDDLVVEEDDDDLHVEEDDDDDDEDEDEDEDDDEEEEEDEDDEDDEDDLIEEADDLLDDSADDILEEIPKKEEVPTSGVDSALGLAGNANAIRVLLDEVGKPIWKAIDRAKEMATATKKFYEKIKNLKSKGLTKLASKYAHKLDQLLRKNASIKHGLKATKLTKFMNKLGKAGDVVDILTSIKKVWDHKGDSLQKFGKGSEEVLRFIFKKWATGFPPVAIADAAITLIIGGKNPPNLDKLVDLGIDGLKGVGGAAGTEAGNLSVKIEDFLKGKKNLSSNESFLKDMDYHRKRIQKQDISQAEKNRKLKGIYKILTKRHGI